MGRGIGAHANLIVEDDYAVIYEYGGWNLNNPKFRNSELLYDGTITILKECFVEPEIHQKLKRMPSGRKRVITKRIPRDVDYVAMLDEGKIIVENCSNCWKVAADDLRVDMIACTLLFYIFLRYQQEGEIPKVISYHV